VSNAENSLTAASTECPSLMASSLLCACMRMWHAGHMIEWWLRRVENWKKRKGGSPQR
jgi:hypothetical protein